MQKDVVKPERLNQLAPQKKRKRKGSKKEVVEYGCEVGLFGKWKEEGKGRVKSEGRMKEGWKVKKGEKEKKRVMLLTEAFSFLTVTQLQLQCHSLAVR